MRWCWYDAVLVNLLISSVNKEAEGKKLHLIRINIFVGNMKTDLGPMSCNATSLYPKVQLPKSTELSLAFICRPVHQAILLIFRRQS